VKLQAPKRIMTTDFSDDDKALAGKIGGLVNTFNEEIYSALSKKLTIEDNLDQTIKLFNVTLDTNGIPKTKLSFKNTLLGKIQGMQVIRVIGNSYPNSQPFVTFTESGGTINIEHIAGLPSGTEFQLVILLIGQ